MFLLNCVCERDLIVEKQKRVRELKIVSGCVVAMSTGCCFQLLN
jgi:hypothetical protein